MPGMLRLVFCCWWALCLGGRAASADGPSGILPTGVPATAAGRGQATPGGHRGEESQKDKATKIDAFFERGDSKDVQRHSPMQIMDDLLQARRFAPDGLLQFKYPTYLTHALLLSGAEIKAHDLQRMPLHRFASSLAPDRIVEIPLTSVGGLRAFHLLVLFTFVKGRTDAVAEQLSSQCQDCSAAVAAFRKASNAYKLSDSASVNDDAPPVLFSVVNVGTRDGAAISAIHPAMQLPVVMHLPPTTARGVAPGTSSTDLEIAAADLENKDFEAKNSVKAARHRIHVADFFSRALGTAVDEDKQLRELLLQQKKDGIHGKLHFFSLSQHHLLLLQRRKNEASLEQRLLQWANARTNRKVEYVRVEESPEIRAKRYGTLALLPVLIAALCWLAWKAVSLLRNFQWVIPTGGVIVYALCSSGLVFSIIHSVPLAGYDSGSSRYVFLAPSTRAQYLLEGLLLSGCSTVASLAALGISKISRAARQSADVVGHQIERPSDSEDAQEERAAEKWRQYFAVASFAVLAVVMTFCSGLVMQCYRSKAAWYAPTFWPSPHLRRGPLKVDWGNMF